MSEQIPPSVSFSRPAQQPAPAPVAAPPPAQPPAAPAPKQTAALATVEMRPSGEIVHVGFDTLPGFEALQRIGKMFAASSLVPQAYQGNIGNCAIAVEMAHRMKANPLMVMQNLYMVHGNPSWAAKFLIASFNQTGKYNSIRYRWSGTENTPSWGCVAYATEKSTGVEVTGPKVTFGMAQKEGWVEKKGSKWQTMPELMMTYRAAAFLVRTHAPELTMGLPTAEEAEDIEEERREDTRQGGVARLRDLATEPAIEGEFTPADPSGDGAPA